MERAVKKKMKYDFSHFLMVSKTLKAPSVGKGSQVDVRTFMNAEEELFLEVCITCLQGQVINPVCLSKDTILPVCVRAGILFSLCV